MRTFPAIIVVLALTNLMLIACKHEIPLKGEASNPPVPTPVCSPDSVYFVNTIEPLIISQCAKSGCHDAISRQEGVILDNYSNIMNYVKPFKATDSKLYEVIVKTDPGDRMPQPPTPTLSSSQVSLIRDWINQGAKNNGCSSCDTTSFTYSLAIKPILQNKCTGCHSGPAASGNIDLTTYNQVKILVDNGKLLGSITHATSFKPMPQGGSKLPDCEIRQIQKWIDGGAPNN